MTEGIKFQLSRLRFT